MTKKSAKKTAASTPDPYLQFVQHLSLRGIGLDSANTKLDRVLLADLNGAAKKMSLDFNVNFIVITLADDAFTVNADCKISYIAEQPLTELPFSLEFVFSALFSLSSPCEMAVAERFANAEAKLIFWPYIRHFVSDMSYRMAMDPILMPILAGGFPSAVGKA